MEEMVFYSIEELKKYLNTVAEDVSVKITVDWNAASENAVIDEKGEVNKALGGDEL